MLRLAPLFCILALGSASTLGCGSAPGRQTTPELATPVEIAAAAEAPLDIHLGESMWQLDNEHCQTILLPHQALPRNPGACLNVDLHGGVSAALLREVDLIAAQVPVLLSIEPGIVFPDVTMRHVVALSLGGGRYDAAPLPPRRLFPAVRYLATNRATVMPDRDWLEADEVLLGLTLMDEDSLTAIRAVADRVIALRAYASVAGRQEELARLTNLRDVRIGNAPEQLEALPTTVTHFVIRGANDATLAVLPRFVHLRSLALDAANVETLRPLSGLGLMHLSLRQARLGENALLELSDLPRLTHLDLSRAQLGENARVELDFPHLTHLDLSGTSNVDDRIARFLAAMTSLEVLHLWRAEIDDTRFLAGLSNLHTLSLSGAGITDEDVAVLSGLSSLRSLSLRGTRVTEAALQALPPVEDLHIGNTRIANLCAHVARLRSLRSLNLSDSGILDAGLSCISQLAELETLDLGGTYISNASIGEIARLPELRDLSLMTTMLSDAGLAELSRLETLRVLDVSGAPLTDASVEPLLAMELQDVGLDGTQLSESAQERIRSALSSEVQTEHRIQPTQPH
ncbi:MAG: leucine-rich repeat domain-containing protein [Polyangiales bacterium]